MLKTRYPEDHLNNVLKVQKLCDSVAGNPCYILTITTDVKKNDISLAAAVAQGKGETKGDSSTQVSSTQEDKHKNNSSAKDNNDASEANHENNKGYGSGKESGKDGG